MSERVFARLGGGQRGIAETTGDVGGVIDPAGWPVYRKVALTRATRVEGPFTVETSEGPLRCEDGYLAVDARGYPYPIAADEFELIYAAADEEPTQPTIVETIGNAAVRIDGRRAMAAEPGVGRAYSLAITYLEEARSRYTEARARELGVFRHADLDKVAGAQGAERERAETLGDLVPCPRCAATAPGGCHALDPHDVERCPRTTFERDPRD